MRFGYISKGFLAAAVLALATVVPLAASVPADAASGARTNTLTAGETLTAGQQLISTSGQYTLTMESNGDLVVSGNGCTIWASGYYGSNPSLILQSTDGNLVVYASSGAIWASGSGNSGNNTGDSLVMQNDGNLVIYNASGAALWATGASKADQLCTNGTMSSGMYIHSSSGQFDMYVGTDGKLVVYNNGAAQWESQYYGNAQGIYTLDMQGTDGNLVVYGPGGTAPWASGTGGTGSGDNLVMQNDGNLVIYNSSGQAVWASGTMGNVSALNWAHAQIGASGWSGLCLPFVQKAYKNAIGTASDPAAYWTSNPMHYTEHRETSYSPAPPAGALVIWGPHTIDGTTYPAHVAISLGDGTAVSTPAAPSTSQLVFHMILSQRPPSTYKYIGWIMPGA
jgi:hypothetical protein